ncbi:HNH endonuclease family protein [Brevibacterium sp. HMSC063G07]|uniref:HNH endonuclease family protein n=1 Tax=Brevibacterium sp. HMSC063G07 TaxID=1739261 RepID=UPI0008A3888A|nr:HNH endonuclease family protein [Brevibacterium sp. HMSC063G07]OFL68511.1 hypothetical protein HMPREF2757_08540 [Brevibacterium sp. HMSC063G07]
MRSPRRWACAALVTLLTLSGCAPLPEASPGKTPVPNTSPTASETEPEGQSAPPTAPLQKPQAKKQPGDGSDVGPTSPGAQQSLAALKKLPVKGKAPATGYGRVEKFGKAWTDTDFNGCRTRDDILTRDLVNITRDGRCKVTSGTLVDAYTGKRIDFKRGQTTSQKVQIDHIVALHNAWITGAQQISQEQRVEFANDPLNLIAVDGATNSAKGNKDAASWLPPNKSYRCTYVGLQIRVKEKYSLWVTEPERAAMERVLNKC